MSPLVAEKPAVARPVLKLAGLTHFRAADDAFQARNERDVITSAAAQLIDLMFIKDSQLSAAERCKALKAAAARINTALDTVCANN